MSRTITLLSEYGMPTDLSLLDAGYFSDDNVTLLYEAKIDLVMRLPERNSTLYNEILKRGKPSLRRKENLVQFRNRYVYVKRIECKIGNDKNLAYAYLGFDVDGSGDTNHKVINSSMKKAKPLDAMHDAFESSGVFILISSIAFDAKDIIGSLLYPPAGGAVFRRLQRDIQIDSFAGSYGTAGAWSSPSLPDCRNDQSKHSEKNESVF